MIVTGCTLGTVAVFLGIGALIASKIGNLGAVLIVAALASFPANAWLLTRVLRKDVARAVEDLSKMPPPPPSDDDDEDAE